MLKDMEDGVCLRERYWKKKGWGGWSYSMGLLFMCLRDRSESWEEEEEEEE